jgi:hypothetical protein
MERRKFWFDVIPPSGAVRTVFWLGYTSDESAAWVARFFPGCTIHSKPAYPAPPALVLVESSAPGLQALSTMQGSSSPSWALSLPGSPGTSTV